VARGRGLARTAGDTLPSEDAPNHQYAWVSRVPGGQGVAGSNPVVPTVGKDPLTLGESPGQWVFFICWVDHAHDLYRTELGTIWGPVRQA
jgi:hypothetical protein